MNKKNFWLLVFLLEILAIQAQKVLVDAEIRPRIEYRDGYSKPLTEGSDPGIFAIQRTRLNFAYISDEFNSLITLQDARTFGQTSNMSETATTGVYEAWGEVPLWKLGAWFKIGRQALTFDDNRLFSSPAWSNSGTSHDVALLKYQSDDIKAHLGYAYNNNVAISSETYYQPVSKYRSLAFIWLSKNLTESLNISAIGVDEGVQDTLISGRNNYTKINQHHAFTFGGNLKFENEQFPITGYATAYFQAGKSSLGKSLSGKLLALKIGFKPTNLLTVNIGADYLSGDDDISNNTQTNFKKLYGADHTFNGIMDYWNTPIANGLLDYYSGLELKIGKKINVQSKFHIFNSDKSLYKGGENRGTNLGSELDLIINYKLNPVVSVEAGLSRYFSTENTLLAKGISKQTRQPLWAYVMFSFKPTFLK